MKRFMLVVAATLCLFACNKEEKKYSASFEMAIPTVADGVATLTLVSDYSEATPVTVPVVFAGDAVMGTDYTVSAEEFVLGGASPVTEIEVTPLVYGSKKSVSASLSLPANFVAGANASCQFTLSDKVGYCSFATRSYLMTDELDVVVTLYDAEGNEKKAEVETRVAVAVAESSTAVEGTHFEFAEGKEAVIPVGKSSGSVKVKLIAVEDNKSDLVLNLVPGAKFDGGQYLETSISILGSSWNLLDGKWVASAFPTDKESMDSQWYGMVNFEGMPVFNSNDSFVFDLETAKFTPSFESAFKNYFVGESNVTVAEKLVLNTGVGEKHDLQLFELDNINRDFSAASQSELKLAYIGVEFTKDDSNKDVLNMYILDYESKSFAPEFFDYMMYELERPTAIMSGVHLILQFNKAE